MIAIVISRRCKYCPKASLLNNQAVCSSTTTNPAAHVLKVFAKKEKSLSTSMVSVVTKMVETQPEPSSKTPTRIPSKASQTTKTTTSSLPTLVKNQNDPDPYDNRSYTHSSNLASYMSICVDVGQINRAFNLLVSYSNGRNNLNRFLTLQHYNIVLRGWAKLRAAAQIEETCLLMHRNNIQPDVASFAFIILGNSKTPIRNAKKILFEMRFHRLDPSEIFNKIYLGPKDRDIIRKLLKEAEPNFEEKYREDLEVMDCKLLNNLKKTSCDLYEFAKGLDLSKLDQWAEDQRKIESLTSFRITSVAKSHLSDKDQRDYRSLWDRYLEMWRVNISARLDETFDSLQKQCIEKPDKIHLYPYLCALDRKTLVQLMLDEVEINTHNTNFSLSANTMHLIFGEKIMSRFLRDKSINEGSFDETQAIYNDYLEKYIKSPQNMSRINPREYLFKRGRETMNRAILKDSLQLQEKWPTHIISAIGRFCYGLILKEIKVDLHSLSHPNKQIRQDRLVQVFFTAYFQIGGTCKIKEEFRARSEFGVFHDKACSSSLKFDHTFLPSCSPPLPWISHSFGGYLSHTSNLIRTSLNTGKFAIANVKQQKLYPNLDSLNALSLCPWIVNKEILDIAIELFQRGGDYSRLKVPLHSSMFEGQEPKLIGSSKPDKRVYQLQKQKFDQKKREMYSLWRDTLYRLSIANHFRDKVFWLPHNFDFRGRTYPIPPHFNHLGADLARSLLYFAKGQALGENGLDWLKLHCINLTSTKKSVSIRERIEFANTIMLEILDSADNPWDGQRWWLMNDHPWQVLACCKEIAKAVRSCEPENYISHLPVHQDGSCNGLQHYAALGRDKAGGGAVNVLPSDLPQDVYSRIAEKVEANRKKDADNGDEIAKALEKYVNRRVVKQTVMTTVYGVTKYGARNQILKQLKNSKFHDEQIQKAASYLTTKTMDSIGEIFERSRKIQVWLNDCAYFIASKCKEPVSWETPLGLQVTQPYLHSKVSSLGKHLTSQSSFMLEGSSDGLGGGNTANSGSQKLIVYNDPHAPVNSLKQRAAFPPNFVHSLDSAHMMLTSLFCERAGITFVSVHDCYWTHASTVAIMNRICREQFLSLHSEPLLESLSRQFVAKYAPKDTYDSLQVKGHVFTRVPQPGDLDLSQVMWSTYFFS